MNKLSRSSIRNTLAVVINWLRITLEQNIHVGLRSISKPWTLLYLRYALFTLFIGEYEVCVNTSVCVGSGAGVKVREQLSGTGCLFSPGVLGLKIRPNMWQVFFPTKPFVSLWNIFFLISTYVYVCVSMWVSVGSSKSYSYRWLWAAQHGHWKLTMGPLQE